MSKKSEKESAAEEAEASQDEPAKKPRRKLIMMAGGAALLVTGAAAGAYVFLAPGSKSSSADEKKMADAKDKSSDAMSMDYKDEKVVSDKFNVVPFKEIIVTISSISSSGRVTSRFLKLNVALVSDPGVTGADRILERQIFIRDAFVEFLMQLTERDLDGSAGLAFLKSELLHRVRQIADSDAPRDLLIADLVIQ